MLASDPELLKKLKEKRDEPSLLKSLNKRTLKKEYPPEIRSFALALQFFSTRAYTFVREEFKNALPSLSTIRKWHEKVDGSPGFTLSAIPVIKKKIREAANKGKRLKFALIMDEMHIRHQIDTDRYTGKTWGYQDFGTGYQVHEDDEHYARESLVFMISCINERWKMPVAYFFLTSIDKKDKANIVLEVNIFN